MYCVVAGEMQVSREGQVLSKMPAGRVFGELAILYNCTRTASIQGISQNYSHMYANASRSTAAQH